MENDEKVLKNTIKWRSGMGEKRKSIEKAYENEGRGARFRVQSSGFRFKVRQVFGPKTLKKY